MKRFLLLLIVCAFSARAWSDVVATAESPGKVLSVRVHLEDGALHYELLRFGKPVVAKSRLGLEMDGAPDFSSGFRLGQARKSDHDETWEQPWGEQRLIRDHHQQLSVDLVGLDDDRRMSVVFRVFDDGVGFRYVLPEQNGLGDFRLMDELTEFRMTGDHRSWSIGAFQDDRYEYEYVDAPLSEVPHEFLHTPLTLKRADGVHVSLHEAALIDYASMTLERRPDHVLKAHLVPWSDGVRVRGSKSLVSPWRTVQVADTAAGLAASHLILNLNDPPAEGLDFSWVDPGKYVGIWWEMHLKLKTWGRDGEHGATTANTRRYIDFAAEHGFDGVLVEGWNPGWDGDWIANRNFDFTTAYPDYDLEGLAAYAREKGTRLIGHHETAGGVENYERQMDDAFELLENRDIRAVKTGYVTPGQTIRWTGDDGVVHEEWHHGQYMVRHHQRVAELAAKHKVMVNAHEPIKDTGLRRTWPNLMTREGAKGQEFNAWGGERRNKPCHTTILPFTRLLAGPMDFTPGIFDVTYEGLGLEPNRVSTTVAKQLALYVTLYSPLHMAADLPANYEKRPEIFQFIKDVPVDWEASRVIDAEIGDYVVTARRDRNSADWYLGAITDESGRLLEVPLGFLSPDSGYMMTLYRDADDADWDTNPTAVSVERRKVSSTDRLPLRLAPGGGVAVRFEATGVASNVRLPVEPERSR